MVRSCATAAVPWNPSPSALACPASLTARSARVRARSGSRSSRNSIQRQLGVGPALVRRYDVDDGLPGSEGAFLLCSFDLVSALVLAGRRDEARRAFDRLCRHAGPLGLYAEQLAADGTAIGNYPQAFTHLALIEAALNLDGAGAQDALHAWAEQTTSASRGGPPPTTPA